jgi:class 3 adenylate cyclase
LTTLGFIALAQFGEGQVTPPRMINLVASQWVMVLVALGGVRLARQLTEVALRQQQEQLLLRQAVGRYFSPQVSRLMIEQPDRLRSQRRDVTALFADLSGFTHLAEHEPEQVVLETLDAYLGALVDVAQKHSGTIDNYLGDALLVVFNAPIDQPDHGSLALACAREMQEVVFNMGLSRSRQGKPYLALVVGINSGRATAGNIGGKARLQYTVIGDAVNVAARLIDRAGRLALARALLVGFPAAGLLVWLAGWLTSFCMAGWMTEACFAGCERS